MHTLFGTSGVVTAGPLHLDLPTPTTLRPATLAIMIIAAVLMFRYRWSVLRVLGVSAVLGLAAGLAARPFS